MADELNIWPGWIIINCGCCSGIQWGGEYPRECTHCDGTGSTWKHKKSGVLACYPGGPFLGREKPCSEAGNDRSKTQ